MSSEEPAMENLTVYSDGSGPFDYRVRNSFDFMTGMPAGYFDPRFLSPIAQGETGDRSGVSSEMEGQIAEGLAIQRAQQQERMREELAESLDESFEEGQESLRDELADALETDQGSLRDELAEALSGEIADSAGFALSDASQNMSLVDRIVQSMLERFGPTAGVRALNELFSILPGTGKITSGIEGLLDAGDDWLGDLASRNPFGRAIDRLAPAERAGRGAIEATENRFSKVVDPIKLGMEWIRIMQNPLAEVAGMAFEGKPNAQRLVRSALTPPPPGMAQGGPVMNYNDPLMMRRGGMTRRRRSRRGGVDSLLARRRRLSPADARRQQRREEVMERKAGPIVPLGGAAGSPHDPFRNKPGMLEAKYRQDQRARERQQQRQAPLEQRRLPDNRAAMEQRMVDEQAVRDSTRPIWYSPTDRARDAAISRYKKSLNMQEDLAGGPLGPPPPQQQPQMPDSVQQMLEEMGAQQERLKQAKQQYQEQQQQPQLPDSVLQMLEEMGAQQSRLDSFKQPDPFQELLEMHKRRDQYDASMPRAAGGGMINADPFSGYRARRR